MDIFARPIVNPRTMTADEMLEIINKAPRIRKLQIECGHGMIKVFKEQFSDGSLAITDLFLSVPVYFNGFMPPLTYKIVDEETGEDVTDEFKSDQRNAGG